VSRVLAPVLTRTTTVLVAGAATLALTACGASFQPLVYEERNSSTATELTIGALDVRDVALEAPEELAHDVGTTVNASLAVVNTSGEDDRLVEVTTDAAVEVALLEDGRPVETIDVPAGAALLDDEIGFALIDITRPLPTGTYAEVTMLFESAGAETFLVPVRTREDVEREYSELVHPEEEH
jgi:copper(I)-binding protein